MTNPSVLSSGISLIDVSYVLPSGRVLFSQLHAHFDQRPTGLVGRNGVGKSVLAQILAGRLLPSQGRCLGNANVHYLAQQVAPRPGAQLADLVGVRPVLDALTRIEMGSCAEDDFNAVGERWDIRQQLALELERAGLGYLDESTPAEQLSGGEAMRVALIGAALSDCDFLLLDEPSNHLDRHSRQQLIAQLQRWQRGLLVISHDRQVLAAMTRTVELSSLGLRSYGGNYSFYAEEKARERQSAQVQLEQHRLEQKRAEAAMRQQRERQERRSAQGNRAGAVANQASILLGRRKNSAEQSAGKLQQQHSAAKEQLALRIRAAQQQIAQDAPIALQAPVIHTPTSRRVVQLYEVTLPFAPAATRYINLVLHGQQRVGVSGANGCGKSTLLKVLAGQCLPPAGECRQAAGAVYLDQQLANLNPEHSVLAQLREVNAIATESELRTRLAQLDLDAQKITCPSAALSGGERVKAALACVLYASPAPALLLLDEPSNHLDLPSQQALEALLRSYGGTLVVVSHDDAFMNNLALNHRLLATENGWLLQAW